MRLPEQRLWDRTKELFSKTVIHAERIENRVGDGMPDLVCLSPFGKTTFIELKVVAKIPKGVQTPLLGSKGLRLSQENWHHNWQSRGGNSGVLIGVTNREMFYVDGSRALELNSMSYQVISAIGKNFEQMIDEIMT